VLGYQVVRRDNGRVEIGPWEREPADLAERVRRGRRPPTLVFVTVPEGKTVKNRPHLDLRPEAARRLDLDGLVSSGARLRYAPLAAVLLS